MMTRKDFVAIAAAMKDGRDAVLGSLHNPSPDSLDPALARAVQRIHSSMCASVALVLAKQNARFDRAKFLAACGVTPANHV